MLKTEVTKIIRQLVWLRSCGQENFEKLEKKMKNRSPAILFTFLFSFAWCILQPVRSKMFDLMQFLKLWRFNNIKFNVMLSPIDFACYDSGVKLNSRFLWSFAFSPNPTKGVFVHHHFTLIEIHWIKKKFKKSYIQYNHNFSVQFFQNQIYSPITCGWHVE